MVAFTAVCLGSTIFKQGCIVSLRLIYLHAECFLASSAEEPSVGPFKRSQLMCLVTRDVMPAVGLSLKMALSLI